MVKQGVAVAMADVKAAEARLKAATSILARDEARVHHWDSEVQRLMQEVDRGVV